MEHDSHSACHIVSRRKRRDWLLWGSVLVISVGYLVYWQFSDYIAYSSSLALFTSSTFELMNKMAWGIGLGILFVGLLDRVPRDVVMVIMGKRGFRGILRATFAGVLLDLCSHGILMVGMKLYERGVSLGQMMAFLIASPWNSLSLTFILWALIGLKLTLLFLVLSMIIAIISGLIFDRLVQRDKLPQNPHSYDLPVESKIIPTIQHHWKKASFTWRFLPQTLIKGLTGSKMILRWIFFGVVLASLIRTFVTPENFETFFGPTLAGLGLTVLIATILEVCSEGSAPIAGDLVTRAGAPGNSFAFLMTGVSTDYTEIMSLRETTKSWKISLFLPLITLPQIILVAWMINAYLL